MFDRIKIWAKTTFEGLMRMDDSPQSIAIGFGLGVFLGILPGTGPLAALGVAFVFKVNKAAALLGSVLTNVWLSLVTFALALKIGCFLTSIDGQMVANQAHDLLKHFSWSAFWDVSVYQILKPLVLGYLVVGFLCGIAAYLCVLVFLMRRRPS